MVLLTDSLFLISSQRFNKQKSVVVCMVFTSSVKKEFRFNESPKNTIYFNYGVCHFSFCEFARNTDGGEKALIKLQQLKLIGRYWGGVGEGKKKRWGMLTLDSLGEKLWQVFTGLFLHSSNLKCNQSILTLATHLPPMGVIFPEVPQDFIAKPQPQGWYNLSQIKCMISH